MATQQPPSAKSTKAELLSAYNQVAKENKSLKTEVETARKQAKASQPAPTPAAAPAESPKESTPMAANSQTIESIIESLSGVRSGFGAALSELSAKLTSEASALEQLRRGSEAESRRLDDLYGIKVGDGTLDAILTEYLEKQRTYEEEFKGRSSAFNEELTDLQRTWRGEQEEHSTALKERETQAKKGRQRDLSEYKYNLDQTRGLDRERYEQEKKEREQSLRDIRETRDREWAKREEEIAGREKEQEELKAKVEQFPRDLETSVKRAKEEGAGIARYQAKVKADLRAKEVEGNKRLFELKIDSLEQSIAKQSTQIDQLTAQLSAALKQVQDLAVKAIEGASNESSFLAIREIAMEQAKTQQKFK